MERGIKSIRKNYGLRHRDAFLCSNFFCKEIERFQNLAQCPPLLRGKIFHQVLQIDESRYKRLSTQTFQKRNSIVFSCCSPTSIRPYQNLFATDKKQTLRKPLVFGEGTPQWFGPLVARAQYFAQRPVLVNSRCEHNKANAEIWRF